jgi:phage gpG-like protein
MGVPIGFHWVNVREISVQFGGVAADLQDFAPIWPYVSAALEAITMKMFDSEGATGEHGEWAELSDRYRAWKERTHPGAPILFLEGRLRRSFTQGGDEHLEIRSPMTLLWGSEVPYAIFHQTGWAKAFGGGRHRAAIGAELERQFTGRGKSARESAEAFGGGGEVTSREVPARRPLDPTDRDLYGEPPSLRQAMHRGIVNIIRRYGALQLRGVYGPGEMAGVSGGEMFVAGKTALSGAL